MISGWLKTSLLSSLLLLSSVSYSGAIPSSLRAQPIHGILVDSRVSDENYETLQKDFQALSEFPLAKTNLTTLLDLMGSESKALSSQNVIDFISSWIHFFVASPVKTEFFLVNKGAQNWFTLRETASRVYRAHAEFWQTHPTELLVFNNIMSIMRPAIGIVELHTPFFDPSAYDPFTSMDEIHPLALSLFRIALLAHEAGHSRGDGFPHVFCPQFLNLKECDEKSNGPNGIQAALLWSVLDACREILKEKEFMPASAVEMCSHSESIAFLKETADDLSSFILTSDYADTGTPIVTHDFKSLFWNAVQVLSPLESTSSGNLSSPVLQPWLPLQGPGEVPFSQLLPL